ncbi:hypothetical protein [Vibrio sp. D431a]|uniref:hypothetical protein n=1 Tax=Vibrio sp. D431a TaxID=2837388 RepID=UPI0025559D2E|nr:hypothetical protein [Vibrio sp. D431a]MDK9789938.1 hypothetical protein [Vibrio sp. D431a]
MSRNLRVNISQMVEIAVEALNLKNSGKSILLPLDFGLSKTLTESEVSPFKTFLQENPDGIDELETETAGLIIEFDEDYLSVRLRRSEYIYVGSSSNYISVYSTLEPTKYDESKIVEIDGLKLYHLCTHDSCWRIDGLVSFEKLFYNSLYEAMKPCSQAMGINVLKLNQNFFGTGLDRIKHLPFHEI